MQQNTETNPWLKPIITERDIVFICPSCQGELVVDREGAGMDCLCAHCGFPLVIPESQPDQAPRADLPPLASLVPSAPPPPPILPTPTPTPTTPAVEEKAPAKSRFGFEGMEAEQVTRRVEDLKRQLKENVSQHTETRGHVNRTTIELHRLQLRLKTLQDRQTDIEAELAAAKDWLGSGAA